jgi:hypothetical protein
MIMMIKIRRRRKVDELEISFRLSFILSFKLDVGNRWCVRSTVNFELEKKKKKKKMKRKDWRGLEEEQVQSVAPIPCGRSRSPKSLLLLLLLLRD